MPIQRLNLDAGLMTEVIRAKRAGATGTALRLEAEEIAARTKVREHQLASLTRELASARRAVAVRTYEAAKLSRLTSDWVTAPTSGNYELRSGLRNLRARSRDLARNDPWVAKFLDMVVSNVVGPRGINLQVRARSANESELSELDKTLNRMVEEKFAEWSHAETASADGRKSWADMQRLFLRTLARDGEPLVRMVAPPDNPFGFALDFLDANFLDETHADTLPHGGRILMGVEVNSYNRAVAYHLTMPYYDYYPGMQAQPRERMRVPASEIIHAFVFTEDGAQVRGVPWAHAVMERLRHLGQYNLAEIVQARMSACIGAFLKPPANDETGGVQTDPDGSPVSSPQFDIEPGMSPILPPGWEATPFDANHPNQNYDAFERAMMRGVASGLPGATYFELANDLTAVNYSSARIGLIQARRVYRALQYWLIEHFNRRVFQAWLKASMMSGALEITVSDYERMKEARWQPPGFDWVDPVKDTLASVTAINNGLTTRTRVLAEQGEDFEETVEQLAAEQKLLTEKGVILSTAGLGELAAAAAQQEGTPPEK